MKKKLILIVTAVIMVMSMTACGMVTVVPIGQESSFTGEEAFDSSAESSNDWTAVVEELTTNATDAAQALGAGAGEGTAVTGSAKIVEFNTDTPKHYLLVEIDGYDGEVQIQAGGGIQNRVIIVCPKWQHLISREPPEAHFPLFIIVNEQPALSAVQGIFTDVFQGTAKSGVESLVQ